VASEGLPSAERALYRPSRLIPASRAIWLKLRERAIAPRAANDLGVVVGVVEDGLEVGGDVLETVQVVGAVEGGERLVAHGRLPLHSSAIWCAARMSASWLDLSPPVSSRMTRSPSFR
jgi:enoyl-CoA hydratase/carnithine racemase